MLRTYAEGNREGGWSLLGALIGSAVGLLVLGGAAQVYVQSYRDSMIVIEKTDLNQELRYLGQFMADDIRRAGSRFWQPPSGGGAPADYRNNPFWKHGNDLAVHDYNGETDACILYAYDMDGDSLVGVASPGAAYEDGDNRERLGFRWGDRDGDGNSDSLEARVGGGGNLTCTEGSWEAVSDPRVRIENLRFTLNAPEEANLSNPGSACASGDWCAERRTVDLTLEGSLSGDRSLRHEVVSTITVRNDRVFEVPPP